jgi:hypothetical protein
VLFQCKSRPRPRTSRHPRSPVPLFLFFGDGRHIFMTRRSERFKFNPDPIRINLRELILSGICWCGGTCTPPLELFPTGLAKSVSPDPVGRVKAKHQREGAACVAAPRTPTRRPNCLDEEAPLGDFIATKAPARSGINSKNDDEE